MPDPKQRRPRKASASLPVGGATVKAAQPPATPVPGFPAELAIPAALDALQPAQRQSLLDTAKAVHDTPRSPPMRLSLKDKVLSIRYDSESTTLAVLAQMAEFGTSDRAFHTGLIGQIAALGAQGHAVSDDASNFVVSVVRAMQPRDELETLLAVQMGAIHAATMMLARRLNHVENIPQQDAAERALNKLARTFAVQVDTLKRYRTGGQQRVTVEHVTVNAGGQAIVGAVATGGGGHG